MLFSPRPLKSLNGIEKIPHRMMLDTFNGNPNTTIISCYTPTNAGEEKDIGTFYNELSSLVHSILKENVLIIGEGMNARIGNNENNKFSVHNSSNRNGEHLTDFSLDTRLTCLNTKFQKRKEKLWTNTYTKNKAHIDYIFMNKKCINSALNCKAFSSFEGVSSDHRIVMAKIRLSLRRNTTQITKTQTMTGPCLTIGILAVNIR